MVKLTDILNFVGIQALAIFLFSFSLFLMVSLHYNFIYFDSAFSDFENSFLTFYTFMCLFSLFVFVCSNKITYRSLYIIISLIIFSLISTGLYLKKDDLYSHFTQKIYTEIDLHIKKFEITNKNILNTKEYSEFLTDKLSNNANNLSKYKTLKSKVRYTVDQIIPIKKNDYVSLMLIKSNNSLDLNIKNKINEITSDKIVTIKEMQEFQDFVINYDNDEYNKFASLINSVSIDSY